MVGRTYQIVPYLGRIGVSVISTLNVESTPAPAPAAAAATPMSGVEVAIIKSVWKNILS